VVASVALRTAAILASAPTAAIPLVVLICVGCPLFASGDVPGAVTSPRARRGREALARLREGLDRLPEVEHPLGL
jgi:hypothetical protein